MLIFQAKYHNRVIFATSRLAYGCTLPILFAQFWVRVLCGEKLALLSATLRTYHKAACDTDLVVIACPRGTSISIEFAQYNKFIARDGISIDDLCRIEIDNITNSRVKAKQLLRGSTFGQLSQKVVMNRFPNGDEVPSRANARSGSISGVGTAAMDDVADDANGENRSGENCMWPNALQYSLLQTVVEACQKKKYCNFNGRYQFNELDSSDIGDFSASSTASTTATNTNQVNLDPCLARKKIVEVAYKCRPYEFRSKVACHNDVAHIECNPYSRITVYSASFGRTEYESIQCPQPQGVHEETCLASYATETVMQICHGRRRCNVAADANTFGSPCRPNSRMYLKVVYTCVPKQVLLDSYETENEFDEPEKLYGNVHDLDVDELSYKESETIPKLYSNATVPASRYNVSTRVNETLSAATITNSGGNSTPNIFEGDLGAVNLVMTPGLSLEDDQERFFVYFLSASLFGIVLCIVAVAVKFLTLNYHRATHRHATSSDKGSSGTAFRTGYGVGNNSTGDTATPLDSNNTVFENNGDIDLQASVPNYISYRPTTNGYDAFDGLSSCNLQLTDTYTSAPIVPGVATSASIMYGKRVSPYILGSATPIYGDHDVGIGSPVVSSILTPATRTNPGGGLVSSLGNSVRVSACNSMVISYGESAASNIFNRKELLPHRHIECISE